MCVCVCVCVCARVCVLYRLAERRVVEKRKGKSVHEQYLEHKGEVRDQYGGNSYIVRGNLVRSPPPLCGVCVCARARERMLESMRVRTHSQISFVLPPCRRRRREHDRRMRFNNFICLNSSERAMHVKKLSVLLLRAYRVSCNML